MKSHASDVGRGPAVNVLIALVPLAFMTLAAASSRAHEGHDHGAPAVTVTAAAPRVEASSEGFELVGIVNGGAMRVFLDRFASNEPVTSATIDVTVDGVAARAEPQPDGSFLVEAPWLATTGATDVVFAIDTGETSDLLIGTLDLPSAATAAEAAPVSAIGVLLRSPVLWAIGLGLLLAGLALGRALTPRPLRADVPDREAAAPVAQPAPQTSPKLRRRVGAAVLLLLSAAMAGDVAEAAGRSAGPWL
jgi:hypothetical protein